MQRQASFSAEDHWRGAPGRSRRSRQHITQAGRAEEKERHLLALKCAKKAQTNSGIALTMRNFNRLLQNILCRTKNWHGICARKGRKKKKLAEGRRDVACAYLVSLGAEGERLAHTYPPVTPLFTHMSPRGRRIFWLILHRPGNNV